MNKREKVIAFQKTFANIPAKLFTMLDGAELELVASPLMQCSYCENYDDDIQSASREAVSKQNCSCGRLITGDSIEYLPPQNGYPCQHSTMFIPQDVDSWITDNAGLVAEKSGFHIFSLHEANIPVILGYDSAMESDAWGQL